jgi:hypothetical protein
MLFSEGLKAKIVEIGPEDRDLSTEEVKILFEASGLGSLLSDYSFRPNHGDFRYNTAAQGENSRWRVVLKLPLKVAWEIVEIQGVNKDIVLYKAVLSHEPAPDFNDDVDASVLFAFLSRQLPKVQPAIHAVRTLGEPTAIIPQQPWRVQGEDFYCLESEVRELTYDYMLGLMALVHQTPVS